MLSKNIKAYRKLKGWTQEKMASEFGISRDNVASYERGLANPSLEFACKICDDIGVSLHDLLYGEILNPQIGEVTISEREKQLEEELNKAYRTIAIMTQERITDSDISIAAEDQHKKK